MESLHIDKKGYQLYQASVGSFTKASSSSFVSSPTHLSSVSAAADGASSPAHLSSDTSTTVASSSPAHLSSLTGAAAALAFFFPLIIPYSMSPQSKAWCILSKVTISLTVLYQIRGPLKTTIQGSTTPTHMLCLQLAMVGFVQSSLETASNSEVSRRMSS